MSYDNLSSVFQNVLKFYQQLTGEERMIPFIFDDFHFRRSRVIGLDMTENRIVTLSTNIVHSIVYNTHCTPMFRIFCSWFVELILRVVQHSHLSSAAGFLPPK